MGELIEKFVEEARKIKDSFDACQNFKRSKGILSDAKQSVDFYEGRQWEDNKKKLPFQKPTINTIQNMVDEKVSSVLNKSWKVNFIVSDDAASTDKVNKFTEWQMAELDQDDLNYRNALAGVIKGSWFNYFYWDEDKEGQIGVNSGGIEVSNIDIQDIAFANVREKNIQKQDWIIVRSRETVKSIKAIAKGLLSDDDVEHYIKSDDLDTIYTRDVEQENEKLISIYTKFFRQDGEVYFEKSTKEILIQSPVSANTLTNESLLREVSKGNEKDPEKKESEPSIYESDANDNLMSAKKESETTTRFKATQYPFTNGVFIERDNCIFGISWVAQLIAPQKNVNQLIATTLLTATKWVMPPIVVKDGAIGTQKIDMSKPGGIITDFSPAGVEGIKLLNLGTMPTAHYELAQSMVSLLKDVYRTNDILNDGRNTSKGMSGYAMNLISSIQEKPIAQWQQKMARSITAEGKILEMYYKLYYRNKRFTYNRTDAEMLELQMKSQDEKVSRMTSDIFDGSEYLETPFNVIVEIGESAKYNEQSFVSLIETLFLNGTVEKLSPETLEMYATLMPDSLFPKKNEFRTLLKQKEQGIIAQKDQTIAQLQQLIAQMQGQLQEVAQRQQIKEQEFKNAVAAYNQNLKRLGQQNDYNRQAANNMANALRQS